MIRRGAAVRRRMIRYGAAALAAALGPACFGGSEGKIEGELEFSIQVEGDPAAYPTPELIEALVFEADPERSPTQTPPDCNTLPEDPLDRPPIHRETFPYGRRKTGIAVTSASPEVEVVLRAKSGDRTVFMGGKTVTLGPEGTVSLGGIALTPVLKDTQPGLPAERVRGRTSAIEAAWDPVPGATHYVVCVRRSVEETFGRACLSDSAQVRLDDIEGPCRYKAENDVEYSLRIMAVNPREFALYSEEVTATPIARPEGMIATPDGTRLAVSFAPVPRATGYVLYYDTDTPGTPYAGTAAASASPVEVAAASGGDGRVATWLEGTKPGGIYFVAVTAVNPETRSESSLSDEKKTPMPYPPPGGVKVTGRTGRVEMAWEPVSGGSAELAGQSPLTTSLKTRYALFYGVRARASEQDVYSLSDSREPTRPILLEETTTVVPSLTDGTPYYFALRTQNDFAQSAYSQEAAATPIAVPANFEPGTTADLASDSVALTFKFSKVQAATGYSIFATTSPPSTVGPSNPALAAFPPMPASVLGVPATQVSTSACADPCTVTIPNVQTHTTYYVGVSATIGTSSESDLTPVKTQLAAPGKPTLTATGSTGRATLTWVSVSGASSYKIYYATASKDRVVENYNGTGATEGSSPVTTSSTSLTMNGLTNGTRYYFVATAVNSAGSEGRPSNEVSTKPLAVPSGFTTFTVAGSLAGAHMTNQVPLSWGPVSGAECYKIQYGLKAGVYDSCFLVKESASSSCPADSGCGTAIAPIYPTTHCAGSRCAILEGLSNGTPYYLTVRALQTGAGARTDSDVSNELSVTPMAAPPSFLVKGRTGRVEASWTAVTGATSGYELRWDLTASTADHLAKPPANVLATTCTSLTLCAAAGTSGCTPTASGVCPAVVPLPIGATFPLDGSTGHFTIAAINSKGRSNSSADTAIPLGKPLLATVPTPKAMTDTRVEIEWQTVSGATGYSVGYDTTSRTGTLLIGDYKGTGASQGISPVNSSTCAMGPSERCALTTLTPDKSYYLSVAATTSAGDQSDPLTEEIVTTLLGAPTTFEVEMGTGKADLSWSAVTGADGYHLFVDVKGASCPPATPASPTTVTGTSTTITTDSLGAALVNGTTYCITVAAKKGSLTCEPLPVAGANSMTNNCGARFSPNVEGIPLAAPAEAQTTELFASGLLKDTSLGIVFLQPTTTVGVDAYYFYYDKDNGNEPLSGTGATQGPSPYIVPAGSISCSASCATAPLRWCPGEAACASTCCKADLTGLTPDTTYYFAVSAVNDSSSTTADGESDLVTYPGSSAKTLIPSPTSLRVTTSTTGTINFQWNPVSGYSGVTYRVYYLTADAMNGGIPTSCPLVDRQETADYTNSNDTLSTTDDYSTNMEACQGNSGAITTASTSRTLTCLFNNDSLGSPDDSYCLRIVAETASNHSDFSDVAWTTPLNYPGCFAGVSAGTTVTLSWCGSIDPVQGYRIYYDKDSAGPPYNGTDFVEGPSPILISGNSTFSKMLTLPASFPPTTFFFSITAINHAYRDPGPTTDTYTGESTYAPEISVTSGLDQPGNFKVSLSPGPASSDANNGPPVARFTWDLVTGATSYRIYYDTDTSGPPYDGTHFSRCTDAGGSLADETTTQCDSGPGGAGINMSSSLCGPTTCSFDLSWKLPAPFTNLGVTHYFSVKAENAQGQSPYATEIQGIPLEQESISVVVYHNSSNPTECPNGPTCVQVVWDTLVTGTTSYVIHYYDNQNPGTTNPPSGGKEVTVCPDPDGLGPMVIVETGCDSPIRIGGILSSLTSYTLQGIPEGVQMAIAVQPEVEALYVGGNKLTGTGDYTVDSNVTTPLPAPDMLGPYTSDAAKDCQWNGTGGAGSPRCNMIPIPSADAPISITMDLAWPTVTGASIYEVHYSKSTDPVAQPYYNLGSTSLTTLAIAGLTVDKVYLVGIRSRSATESPCTDGGGGSPNVCTGPILLTDPTAGDCECKNNSPTPCTQGPPGANGSTTGFLDDCRGLIILDAERPTFGGAVTTDKTDYKGGAVVTPGGSHQVSSCHSGESGGGCDPGEDVITFTATLTDYIHTLNDQAPTSLNTFLTFVLGNTANPLTNMDNAAAATLTVPACASGTPADPAVGAASCGAAAPSGNSRTYTVKYRFNTANTVGQGATPTSATIGFVAYDGRTEVNLGLGNKRATTVSLNVDNRRPQLSAYTVSPTGAANGTVVTIQFTTDEELVQQMGAPSGPDDGSHLAELVEIGGLNVNTCSATAPPAPITYTCTRTILNGQDTPGTKTVTIRGWDLAGNDIADETSKTLLIDYNTPSVCSPVVQNAVAYTKSVSGNNTIQLTVTAANPGTACPVGTNGLAITAYFDNIDSFCVGMPAQPPSCPTPPVHTCVKSCTTAGGGSCSVSYTISAGNTKIAGSYAIPIYVQNPVCTTASSSPSVTYDPDAPVVTAISPGDASGQFKSQLSGAIPISWTTTDPNKDRVQVDLYRDSGVTFVRTIEAASSGNDDGISAWSLAGDPELSTLRIQIRATDLAGNVSATQSANDFTLDNTVPSPPSPALVTITMNAPGSNDTAQGLASSVEGFATVEVHVTNTCTALATGFTPLQAAANGAWGPTSIGDNQSDATNCVYYKAFDRAGNPSGCSACDTNDTQSQTPATALISVTMNPPGSNDTVSGPAGSVEGSATIRIYSDALLTNLIGSAVAAADGSWAPPIDIGDNQADAANQIYLRATDAYGNLSTTAIETNDITAPSNPSITSTTPPSPGNDPTPVVNGIAEANSTVQIYDDGFGIGSGTAGGGGTFSITPTIAVTPNASNALTARATDAAGNVSGFSGPFTYVHDNSPPNQPDVLKLTVTMNPPGSNDTLSGAAGAVDPNINVMVYSNAALTILIGSTVAAADGSFTAFSIGDNQGDAADLIYVVADDGAGNQSAPVTKSNDKTAPSLPDAVKVTVTMNAPGSNDTITGVAAAVEASSTVKVYSNAGLTVQIGSGPAAGDGSFASFSIGDNQGDASDLVYVTATDAAGNRSTAASETNDKTGPTIATISVAPTPAIYEAGDMISIQFCAENEGGVCLGANPTVTVDGNAAGFNSCTPGSAPCTGSGLLYVYTRTVAAANAVGTGKVVSITATDDAGNSATDATTTLEIVYTLQAGWPKPTAPPAPVVSSPAIADISSGGNLESAIGSTATGGADLNLYVLNSAGGDVAGWPVDFGAEVRASPAVANMDGDADLEIVVGGQDGNLRRYEPGGAAGWNAPLIGPLGRASAAIADIEIDTQLEVVAAVTNGTDVRVSAFSVADGTQEWERILSGEGAAGWAVTPALAQVNGLGALEVVVGTGNGLLRFLDGGTGADSSVCGTGSIDVDAGSSAMLNTSPAIGNLNGGAAPDVAVAANDGRVHVVDTMGGCSTLTYGVTGSPVISASPAVGNLFGGAELEIVIATESGRIHLLDGTTATDLGVAGWPKSGYPAIKASPVIGDIDNDGTQEVLVAFATPYAAEAGAVIKAWEVAGGAELSGFPLITPSSGIESTPALGNLDTDGGNNYLEIVAGSLDGNIYAWEVRVLGSGTATHAWPMFHKNAARTGN